MSEPRNSHEKLLDAVLHRAQTDRGFRQLLLSSPRQAIWEGFGVRVPDEYRVDFIEKDPAVDALIVLPPLSDDPSVLSDADLDAIAGGLETREYFWSEPGS